ncbi:MAG: hypothetical protein HON70_13635, partial [Lentisphaerae bacterium]|nr:hypothetical protein [Lentisphaerota bacterium]
LIKIPILDQDALECLAPLPVVDDGKWEPKVRLGGKQPRIPRRRRALLPADDRVLRLPGTCRFGAEVRTAALRTRAGGDPAGWQQWGISTYGVDAYEQMLADPLMTRETWTVHFEHVRRASVDQLANRVGAELRRLGWTYARELRPYELSTQPQPVRDGKAVPKERLTSEQRDRPGAVYQQGDRLVSFLCGTTGEHVSLQFRLLGLLPEELLGYDYDAKWSSVWDTLGAAGE